MSTSYTDALRQSSQPSGVAGLIGDPAVAIQRLGFLAVIEQLELLRDLVADLRGHIVDLRSEIKQQLEVGGSPLGEAIQIQIDDRSIQYSNLADAIAFALEQRGVIR